MPPTRQQVWNRYFRPLFDNDSWARAIIRGVSRGYLDDPQVEDILQEVRVQTFFKARSWKPSRGPALAFAKVVARSTALSCLRTSAREARRAAALDLVDTGDTPTQTEPLPLLDKETPVKKRAPKRVIALGHLMGTPAENFVHQLEVHEELVFIMEPLAATNPEVANLLRAWSEGPEAFAEYAREHGKLVDSLGVTAHRARKALGRSPRAQGDGGAGTAPRP